jgi:hypothetical protein
MSVKRNTKTFTFVNRIRHPVILFCHRSLKQTFSKSMSILSAFNQLTFSVVIYCPLRSLNSLTIYEHFYDNIIKTVINHSIDILLTFHEPRFDAQTKLYFSFKVKRFIFSRKSANNFF